MAELEDILARKAATEAELTSHEPAMFKEAQGVLETLLKNEGLSTLDKIAANVTDAQAKMSLGNVSAAIKAALGVIAIKIPVERTQVPIAMPVSTPTPEVQG
ncbi:MAG: hypothetical protein B7Z37_03085 [Verrucomicrobia bacterium 12-59-8]|nr:MAG: hypothetical protein B7Z37_03085 [Verrucomicrobia bacterium 12-59-8]